MSLSLSKLVRLKIKSQIFDGSFWYEEPSFLFIYVNLSLIHILTWAKSLVWCIYYSIFFFFFCKNSFYSFFSLFCTILYIFYICSPQLILNILSIYMLCCCFLCIHLSYYTFFAIQVCKKFYNYLYLLLCIIKLDFMVK